MEQGACVVHTGAWLAWVIPASLVRIVSAGMATTDAHALVAALPSPPAADAPSGSSPVPKNRIAPPPL